MVEAITHRLARAGYANDTGDLDKAFKVATGIFRVGPSVIRAHA